MCCEGGCGIDDLLREEKKKGLRFLVSLYSQMVRPEGFELPTYRFVACCSIQLSYERLVKKDTKRTLKKGQVFFFVFLYFGKKKGLLFQQTFQLS